MKKSVFNHKRNAIFPKNHYISRNGCSETLFPIRVISVHATQCCSFCTPMVLKMRLVVRLHKNYSSRGLSDSGLNRDEHHKRPTSVRAVRGLRAAATEYPFVFYKYSSAPLQIYRPCDLARVNRGTRATLYASAAPFNYFSDSGAGSGGKLDRVLSLSISTYSQFR